MRNPQFRSVLADRFTDFVAFRRLSGVEFHDRIRLLEYFDRFLYQEGFQGCWPSRDVIERYMDTIKHLCPGSRKNRFSIVRQFCRYLSTFEPKCYVPVELLPQRRTSPRIAHIYTETEIKDMLDAALELPPLDSLRPKTYSTLFGLLYTAGLRCSEAFALNLGNLDCEQSLLSIHKSKFGKSRLVPISSSTTERLQEYIQRRIRVAPSAPEQPLFINLRGHRLIHQNVYSTFLHVLKQCGLGGGKSRSGPHLHDIRHTFACTRILAWYREGKDINVLLPALATYLGHVNVTSTQVYLQATAGLLAEANQRFLNNFRENVSPKGETL